jgi:hypothetical protein
VVVFLLVLFGLLLRLFRGRIMPYKDGKVNMRGYGATTSTTKPVTKDSYKIRLAKAKAAKKKGGMR